MAAAGDERYLVCAAVAAAFVSVANCSSYPIDQVTWMLVFTCGTYIYISKM